MNRETGSRANCERSPCHIRFLAAPRCSRLLLVYHTLFFTTTLYKFATASGNLCTGTASILCCSSEEADTPITRFQRYLRIKTAHPEPDYSSAVSFLTSQAHSIDLQHQILEFSPGKPLLILTWPGSDPSLPSLLFNSHLDSVPADSSKWIHPPFAAVRTPDGRIYARGAQDDKCIGMQYLEAIRNLKEKDFTPTRTIHLSYVPDEEIGGFEGFAKFAGSKVFEDLNVGFMLDEGQASHCDEFRVFYADRMPWEVKIKAKGPPRHGSRMYDNSAMENLMKSIEVISKFRESHFDAVKSGEASNSEVISINPVYLKAGAPSLTGFTMNLQPSEAEAGFDLRLIPTADPDEMRRRIAQEWAPAARNMSYEAITSAGGKLAKPEILASTTDSRFVGQKGIPVLGFSPMTNNSHSASRPQRAPTRYCLHEGHKDIRVSDKFLEFIHGLFKELMALVSS